MWGGQKCWPGCAGRFVLGSEVSVQRAVVAGSGRALGAWKNWRHPRLIVQVGGDGPRTSSLGVRLRLRGQDVGRWELSKVQTPHGQRPPAGPPGSRSPVPLSPWGRGGACPSSLGWAAGETGPTLSRLERWAPPPCQPPARLSAAPPTERAASKCQSAAANPSGLPTTGVSLNSTPPPGLTHRQAPNPHSITAQSQPNSINKFY